MVASSIIPETMMLGQIDCNANPELSHHKIVLMLWTPFAVSRLFHFLKYYQLNKRLKLFNRFPRYFLSILILFMVLVFKPFTSHQQKYWLTDVVDGIWDLRTIKNAPEETYQKKRQLLDNLMTRQILHNLRQKKKPQTRKKIVPNKLWERSSIANDFWECSAFINGVIDKSCRSQSDTTISSSETCWQ